MFTGLVEMLAEVAALRCEGTTARLTIRAPQIAAAVALGDSIAVNGCCLTVVEMGAAGTLDFDVGAETLARTNLGQLAAGGAVNLERSLEVGQRLGGHLVTGHIDGQGTLAERRDEPPWATCWFAAPAPLMRQIARQGSIAIDGVSLTVVDVADDRFSVMLIPHTLAMTTLGRLRPGDAVNLETDILAKYVERQLVPSAAPGPQLASSARTRP